MKSCTSCADSIRVQQLLRTRGSKGGPHTIPRKCSSFHTDPASSAAELEMEIGMQPFCRFRDSPAEQLLILHASQAGKGLSATFCVSPA